MTLQVPQKFQICTTYFDFELLPQLTSSINVDYILYRSAGIYTQRILLSHLAVECLLFNYLYYNGILHLECNIMFEHWLPLRINSLHVLEQQEMLRL